MSLFLTRDELAERIRMLREWFQDKTAASHRDLRPTLHEVTIEVRAA